MAPRNVAANASGLLSTELASGPDIPYYRLKSRISVRWWVVLTGCVGWPDELAARYRDLGYWRSETLGDLLHEWAELYGDAIALVAGPKRWSYRQLDEWADRLASGLHRRGIRSRDRLLVQLPNLAEFLPLCFALFRIGAIPVLALPPHRESEILHLAGLAEVVAYVLPDRHAGFDHRDLARRARSQIPSIREVFVIGDPAEFTAFADLDDDPVRFPTPDPADVALLLPSGRTTNLPKLIPRTHDDYAYNFRASAVVCGLNPASRYLVALPIAHQFTLACPGALGTLHAGGTVVMAPSPSPDDTFPLIESERITITALVPPLAHLWMDMAELVDADLSSLSLLQVGGAKLEREAACRVRAVLRCGLQQAFGMSEGLVNLTRLEDPDDVINDTQGRPISDADEIRIVDAADHDVAEGQTGELLTRGPYTVRGYYRQKEYNDCVFTDNGYYRTGDLVRQLPGGHLVVEGRVKDVINRGGEKVPVVEVENHLLHYPSVDEAAVIGLPDTLMGERTCACVVFRGDAATLPELIAFLRKRGVAAFKLPDRLELFDSFPRTELGRIRRERLADEVAHRIRGRPQQFADGA
ncbi:MAG: dhbE [Bryobacterales bacterium]|nr:dhbE [Bryobacterales bacterium]